MLCATDKILFCRTWEPLNNLEHRSARVRFTCQFMGNKVRSAIPSVMEGFDFSLEQL